MARRSRARETALQLLYRQDLNPAGNLESAGEFIEERLEDQALRTTLEVDAGSQRLGSRLEVKA